MAPPKHPKHQRTSLASAFDGLDISKASTSQGSQEETMPSHNLIRSIRETMKKALRTKGSVRAPSLRHMDASFTITMDESYDYNILGEDADPDEIHADLKKFIDEFSGAMQNPGLSHQAIDDHLGDTLARMVFSSNMIESAGGGLDVTLKLCRAVFQGQDVPDIQERDADYEALKQDLIQKGSPHGMYSVLRSCREIVHHAKAATYLFTKVYVNGEDISEDIILETHRILTNKIDIEQGMSWTQYSGVYRQCNVSAGLHQFLDPILVPGAMKKMINSLNKDIQDAVDCGEIDPVALAAKYSYTFVNIHPFVDGNGRTCRLILNALLLKYSGILVCIGEQGDDREKYLEIAASASLAESSAHEEDDDDDMPKSLRPKYYKALASFTLQHARNSIRKLAGLAKKD